jgi:hypothetical protein
MHALDAQAAALRFADAAFSMPTARARYRAEPNPLRLGFRAWARRTYGPHACVGKLALVVERRAA